MSAGFFIHNHYENQTFDSVEMSDERAAYELTKILIEHGHRRIGGIFKYDDMQGLERFKGFIQCLSDYGINYDAERMNNPSRYELRDYMNGWNDERGDYDTPNSLFKDKLDKQWQDTKDREKYSRMADSRPLHRKSSLKPRPRPFLSSFAIIFSFPA